MRSAPSISPASSLDLTQGQIAELLVELESTGFEGVVEIDAGPLQGRLLYNGGSLVEARLGEEDGRPALDQVLSLAQAHFTMTVTSVSSAEAIIPSVATLLARDATSQQEWSELCAHAPPMGSVLRLSTEALGLREDVDDSMSNLLALIDSRRSLQQVLEDSASDPVTSLAQVIDAIGRGLVEPSPTNHSLFPLANLQDAPSHAAGGGPTERRAPEPEVNETRVHRRRLDSASGPTTLAHESHRPYAPDAPNTAAIRSARRYIGRYEVLTRIGHGGMGTVYLCRTQSESTGFRRHFALKLLRRHLCADPQATDEFLNEARVAGVIHHANVVGVLDAGFHDNRPYLVMDYVEGCSLRQLTQGGAKCPPHRLIPIVLEAMAGLHAVHALRDDTGVELRLVHCDVSPENMLVGVDGSCRLSDFGISRRTKYTEGATTQGKIGYLAPEQIAGHPFDQRADIFSMGVVLWNCLTGKELFGGSSIEERLFDPFNPRVVAPSVAGADCTEQLDRLVLRALAGEPDERFSSSEEMLSELRATAYSGGRLATSHEIAAWVRQTVGEELALRRLTVLDMSRGPAAQAQPYHSSHPPLADDASEHNIPIALTRISSPPPKWVEPPGAVPAPFALGYESHGAESEGAFENSSAAAARGELVDPSTPIEHRSPSPPPSEILNLFYSPGDMRASEPGPSAVEDLVSVAVPTDLPESTGSAGHHPKPAAALPPPFAWVVLILVLAALVGYFVTGSVSSERSHGSQELRLRDAAARASFLS